jgi:hypothetical protein
MLVAVWKSLLIAPFLVDVRLTGFDLQSDGSPDASLQRQGIADAAVPDRGAAPSLVDKTTRQAERQGVEQAREKSLKDLAQGFAGLIAGPSQDLVWCPKYRWPVLTEAVAERLKALLQERRMSFL